jgi:hypothetical protein
MTDNIFDIDFDDSTSLVTIQNKGDRRMGVDRRLFSYPMLAFILLRTFDTTLYYLSLRRG